MPAGLLILFNSVPLFLLYKLEKAVLYIVANCKSWEKKKITNNNNNNNNNRFPIPESALFLRRHAREAWNSAISPESVSKDRTHPPYAYIEGNVRLNPSIPDRTPSFVLCNVVTRVHNL